MNTPAKKRVAKKATAKAARKTAPPVDDAKPAKKNLLTAGIKAIASVHEEAVARQSRVFESLLGLGKEQPASPLAAAALDPFGFRKFEDVFDQRVARTLQRLEVPSADAVARLEAEIASLRDEVAALRIQIAKR